MPNKETIKQSNQENTRDKADNFDKEKEVIGESNNKSSANNNNGANDKVMNEQKETD